MNINEYKHMYEKMEISDELDVQIRNRIMNLGENKPIKVKHQHTKMIVALTTIAFVIGILGINNNTVSAAIEKVVQYFAETIWITNSNGDAEAIDMVQKYITLSNKAPKKMTKFDSMKSVSEKIGIKLLESPKAYSAGKCVNYTPCVDEKGKLLSVTIGDAIYYIGDLKNINLFPSANVDEMDIMNYDPGEHFKTPVMVQINIKTDENLNENYRNNELSFVSERMNIDLTEETRKDTHAEVYTLKTLGTKAVLFDMETDGPASWDLTQPITTTNAVFVYEGIEYIYAGGVSHETMKEFLETLQ